MEDQERIKQLEDEKAELVGLLVMAADALDSAIDALLEAEAFEAMPLSGVLTVINKALREFRGSDEGVQGSEG
jgi:hypothetical protein